MSSDSEDRFCLLSFVKYTMVSRVESTTVYPIRDIADMTSLYIMDVPFCN